MKTAIQLSQTTGKCKQKIVSAGRGHQNKYFLLALALQTLHKQGTQARGPGSTADGGVRRGTGPGPADRPPGCGGIPTPLRVCVGRAAGLTAYELSLQREANPHPPWRPGLKQAASGPSSQNRKEDAPVRVLTSQPGAALNTFLAHLSF